MNDLVVAHFDDVEAPVVMQGCEGLTEYLDAVFVTWPYSLSHCAESITGKSISISRHDQGFRVSSAWMADKYRNFEHPVDVVCWLVVELSWAYLEQNPETLCLHGAAVEIAGRLVLLPSQYRAGKSVLSACLAARGQRVFGDDIVPVAIGDGGETLGVSTGVAPRLRVPVPTDITVADNGFIQDHFGEASLRYVYLDLTGDLLARRGVAMPIGAIVLLERLEAVETSLEPVSTADILQAAIWQNFSRQMPSANILNVLRCLVQGTEHYRLRYSSASDAADCLASTFSNWQHPVPLVQLVDHITRYSGASGCNAALEPHQLVSRVVGVFECEADGNSFLASPEGSSIFRLNLLASAIWRLLETPMCSTEAVEIVQNAFADQDSDKVCRDVLELMQSLLDKGFIELQQLDNQS